MSTRPVAIVTAASRGIGAACARQLSVDGYDVAVMSRSEQVHSIAKEIDGLSFQGDLTSPHDILRLVKAVKERWGRLDVLVNNAGDAARGDLETLPDDAWLGGFELLFMSVLRASREALPLMRSSGGGVIVNISAADGLEPTLMFPVSGSMRAAVSALTKLLATPLRTGAHTRQLGTPVGRPRSCRRLGIERDPPVASGNVRTGCRRGLLPLQRRWIVSHRRESPGRRWVVEGTVRHLLIRCEELAVSFA